MIKIFTKAAVLFLTLSSVTFYADNIENNAIEEEKETVSEEEEKIDPQAFILGHLADSHEFHIADWNNKPIGVPLPVILWSEGNLIAFLSSDFHHDNSAKHIVEKSGQKFVMLKDVIYKASEKANENGQFIQDDKDGNILNAKPLDFSITKNVVTLAFGSLILLIIFISAARFYRNKENTLKAPKGGAKVIEPLIVFIVDEIIKPNVGEKHYKKYSPYLLTIFFMVLFMNLFGLVPIFPFGANLTGNIAFTMSLAVFTFVITQFAGTKEYWKEVFAMPGLPKWMLIIMTPVEFISLFTKPFALTVRLFASMLSGHIIILSLVLMIFLFKSWAVVPLSGAFVIFLNLIEVLICVIQAYIFTLLSSLYIGMAKAEPHQHEGH